MGVNHGNTGGRRVELSPVERRRGKQLGVTGRRRKVVRGGVEVRSPGGGRWGWLAVLTCL